MIRLLPSIILVIILCGCKSSDPEPVFESCIEGAYYNDDGAVYYVTCPEQDATKCKKTFKLIIEVKGYTGGDPGMLVIRSLTDTSVEKLEREVSMNSQKFQIQLINDRSIPTTHKVTFVLPATVTNCTVNDAPDFYTYDVDLPCGSQVGLKFTIICGDN